MAKEHQLETEDEETYRISELSIDSVGLVESGANQENWLILKHDDKESSMADNTELTIEEVEKEAEDNPSFWAKVKAYVQELTDPAAIEKANKFALYQAARILTAGGYPVTAAKLASMLGGNDEDDDEETSGKPYKAKAEKEVAKSDLEPETTDEGGTEPVSEQAVETVLSKAIEDRLVELEKAQKAQIEAIEKALEEKYKGEVEALRTQADEAKTEVAKAVEAREERVWIEKAAEMTFALGADQKELGKHLHVIAKTAPAETVDYIVAVLKAADHTLTESNLFSEFGTSQVAEEVEVLVKAEKIAKEKGISLAEALLELTPAEQAEMTKGFNQGGKN